MDLIIVSYSYNRPTKINIEIESKLQFIFVIKYNLKISYILILKNNLL